MPYKNIEDRRRQIKEWYRKKCAADPGYRERESERTNEWQKKRYATDVGFRAWRKQDNSKRYAFARLHTPWVSHWYHARTRCVNQNAPCYKHYGGKNIKMLLSKEDVRRLYIRDQAWDLKDPTIDRIDPNGDYCVENCQFIERAENTRRGNVREYKKIKHSETSWN